MRYKINPITGKMDLILNVKNLKNFIDNAGNISNTETDLYSYTIPANTYKSLEEKITFEIFGQFTATFTGEAVIRAYIDDVEIFNKYYDASALGTNWTLKINIITNDENFVKYSILSIADYLSISPVVVIAGSLAFTFNTSHVLKITGQTNGNTDNDVIIANFGFIYYNANDN